MAVLQFEQPAGRIRVVLYRNLYLRRGTDLVAVTCQDLDRDGAVPAAGIDKRTQRECLRARARRSAKGPVAIRRVDEAGRVADHPDLDVLTAVKSVVGVRGKAEGDFRSLGNARENGGGRADGDPWGADGVPDRVDQLPPRDQDIVRRVDDFHRHPTVRTGQGIRLGRVASPLRRRGQGNGPGCLIDKVGCILVPDPHLDLDLVLSRGCGTGDDLERHSL